MKLLIGPLFLLAIVFMPQLAGAAYLVALGDLPPLEMPGIVFNMIETFFSSPQI